MTVTTSRNISGTTQPVAASGRVRKSILKKPDETSERAKKSVHIAYQEIIAPSVILEEGKILSEQLMTVRSKFDAGKSKIEKATEEYNKWQQRFDTFYNQESSCDCIMVEPKISFASWRAEGAKKKLKKVIQDISLEASMALSQIIYMREGKDVDKIFRKKSKLKRMITKKPPQEQYDKLFKSALDIQKKRFDNEVGTLEEYSLLKDLGEYVATATGNAPLKSEAKEAFDVMASIKKQNKTTEQAAESAKEERDDKVDKIIKEGIYKIVLKVIEAQSNGVEEQEIDGMLDDALANFAKAKKIIVKMLGENIDKLEAVNVDNEVKDAAVDKAIDYALDRLIPVSICDAHADNEHTDSKKIDYQYKEKAIYKIVDDALEKEEKLKEMEGASKAPVFDIEESNTALEGYFEKGFIQSMRGITKAKTWRVMSLTGQILASEALSGHAVENDLIIQARQAEEAIDSCTEGEDITDYTKQLYSKVIALQKYRANNAPENQRQEQKNQRQEQKNQRQEQKDLFKDFVDSLSGSTIAYAIPEVRKMAEATKKELEDSDA